jgi:hypothetical protein
MSKGDDDHQEHVVVHGVDDAVVTDANAETGSPFQGAGGWWTWILRQEGDRTLQAATNRRVELA